MVAETENSKLKNDAADENDETERMQEHSQAFADNKADDFIDAEFEETPRMHPRPLITEDHGDAIHAEPVAPIGKKDAAGVDDDPDEGQREMQDLLASIPKDTDVTIVVKRKADRGDRYRVPCNKYSHIDNIEWDKRPIEDVYAEVQRVYGGGRYHFQLHYDGKLQSTYWNYVIFDPPFKSEAEKLAAKDSEPERTQEHSQPFAAAPAAAVVETRKSAFEEMQETLEQAKKIKELLGVPEAPVNNAPAPMPVEDQLKLKIFDRMADNPQFTDKLTDLAFGVFQKDTSKKDKESWVDVAKEAIKSPGEVLQLLGGIVSFGASLLGRGGTAPPNTAINPAMHPTGAMMPAGTAPITGLRMPPPAAGQTAAPEVTEPAGQQETADAATGGLNQDFPPGAPPVAQTEASQAPQPLQQVVW